MLVIRAMRVIEACNKELADRFAAMAIDGAQLCIDRRCCHGSSSAQGSAEVIPFPQRAA